MAKQAALAGMENRAHKELHELAEKYASTRDKRMDLLRSEVDLKGQLLTEMKKLKKTKYTYENLEIEIVPTAEKLKVRIHDSDD